MSTVEMAIRYASHGYRIVPLRANQKWPPPTNWQRKATSDVTVVGRLFSGDANIAVVTSNVTVVDIDVKDAIAVFMEKYGDAVTTIAETARGAHAYFRAYGGGSRKLQGGDLKAKGGYVVGVGSVVDGWTYRFMDGHDLVPVDELRPLPADIVPPRRVSQRPEEPDELRRINRGIAYGRKVVAIQGQAGDATTFAYIRFLRDIGLTQGEAYAVLVDWNRTNAIPEWHESDLRRKLRYAYERKGGESPNHVQ